MASPLEWIDAKLRLAEIEGNEKDIEHYTAMRKLYLSKVT